MSGRTAAAASSTPGEPDIDLAAFEAADIDPQAFDHEAHVYVAWKYLRETSLPDALQRYSAALKRITRKLGVEGKYHETITWFFIIAVAERCGTGRDRDWTAFKAGNPDLVGDAKTLLTRHYSKQRLASPAARTQFLLPDLAPLA